LVITASSNLALAIGGAAPVAVNVDTVNIFTVLLHTRVMDVGNCAFVASDYVIGVRSVTTVLRRF